MADERTMSVITWLNSAKRAKMDISTIFAQAQVRQWDRYNPDVSAMAFGSSTTNFFYIHCSNSHADRFIAP